MSNLRSGKFWKFECNVLPFLSKDPIYGQGRYLHFGLLNTFKGTTLRAMAFLGGIFLNPVYLSAQILSVSKFIQAKWYFFDWKPTFARICKAVTTTVYEVCRIHAFYFIRTALPILRWLKKSSRDFFPINPTPPSLPIGHRLETMRA